VYTAASLMKARKHANYPSLMTKIQILVRSIQKKWLGNNSKI
jgi:hypothetical protein